MKIENDLNYKIVQTFDVQPIVNELSRIGEGIWNADTTRQTSFSPHKHTKSIFINNVDLQWNGAGYPIKKHTITSMLNQYTDEIVSTLEKHFNGRVGRTLYINLPAGCEISKHVDNGYYLMNTHRCHIPIMTNDDVDFYLGEETLNMKAGTCYEINNAKLHGVNNRGSTDRIHLLIDIIPMSAFK